MSPKQAVAHYRIEEAIGRGGMGVVFRATDTKLGREVAIKMLPPEFAADPERLVRFEREARILASLTHPNIGAIHGLEESAGVRYLILELVPGETIADRLRRRRLEVNQAIDISRQIAEALQAAHEKGIVHRDLKPANIKVTPQGRVKVLDFGLAKAFQAHGAGSDGSSTDTMTVADATPGKILGTAAYMSPEQARGLPVDKRTDVWAFGCVLYEMLSGQRPFAGATVSDSIAAVLSRDPDWTLLPSNMADSVRTLLRRCLQKDPERRLRDIGDAKLELDDIANAPAASSPSMPQKSRFPITVVACALVAAIAGAALWAVASPKTTPSTPVTRFTINLPPGGTLPVGNGGMGWSPDGSRLAYRVAGKNQMYVRAISEFDAKPVPGTEGYLGWPVFSPDGQWIAFRQGPKWKKVGLSGGPPVNLFDAPAGGATFAAWGADDRLVFGVYPATAWRMPVTGGNHEELSLIDPRKGERWGGNPELLPDGKTVLFNMRTKDIDSLDDLDIAAYTFDTKQRKILIQGGRNVTYMHSGHLVYLRGGALHAVPFDSRRLAVTGPPVLVLDGVYANMTGQAAHFAIARNGSLAYAPGGSIGGGRQPVWVTRTGKAEPVAVPPRGYLHPRVSPDGRQFAIEVEGANHDVYLYDMNRSTFTKLTFDGSSHWPVWTPDGTKLTYRIGMPQPFTMWLMPADRSRPAEPLLPDGSGQSAASWSPDGTAVAFTQVSAQTGGDVHVLDMRSERKARAFAQTRFDEGSPRFSPDGRWIAYCSNESGRNEIYVQAYPGPGAKIQISVDGGTDPVWKRDGGELYYRNGDKMMAVSVRTGASFGAGKPVQLWEAHYNHGMNSLCGPPGPTSSNYDVTPDDQRFLMIQEGNQDAPASEIRVVLNWWDEGRKSLKRPAGQ